MKKTIFSLLLSFLLASCIQNSNGVYSGLYTSWKDRDPISRVDNSVSTSKRGKACTSNIMGIMAKGDSSIEAAKKEGKISKVAYVDRTYKSFVVYQEGCTVVHGN